MTRIHLAWIALAALTLATPRGLHAQHGLWGVPLVEKIDSLASAVVAEGRVAGVAIGVSRNGEVLTRGYGWADLENGVPITAETVFRVGSVTKQFTAAAILQLVDRGLIALDSSIANYLPEFTDLRAVTVRHLLGHTSGIVRRDGHLTLQSAPGEQFAYGNTGYLLLGRIVAAVSGVPYDEYVRDHLVGPVGLHSTMYCDEPKFGGRMSEGYEWSDGALAEDRDLDIRVAGAAGALCSTVPDLLRWNAALHGSRVLSPASYQAMTTAGTTTDGTGTGYGFGLDVMHTHGHRSVGHSGTINGFSAMVTHYPGAGLDVVVLSNTRGEEAGRIAEIIALWALGEDVPEPLDRAIPYRFLVRYVGTYELSPGEELTVIVEDGHLFFRQSGQQRIRLRALGGHRFIADSDESTSIVFSGDGGRVTRLMLVRGEARTVARQIR